MLCLAVDKVQAAETLGLIRAFFERIPLLKAMVVRETKDGVWLNNGARLVVSAANFRGIRGRTIACAIFDEVAFWRSDESASPDVEVFNAVSPGTLTLPNAMLIGISSAYMRSGLLYEKWRKHYGQPDDRTLVVRGPSKTFNPTLDQREIDAKMAEDPAKARAEYLSEWRDDVAALLTRELVESAIDAGVIVRPYRPGLAYKALCDPGGGRKDSYTLAISHAEGGRFYLDCLLEIRAPFNPDDATGAIARTVKAYGLASVTGDGYSADWVVGAFRKFGVSYRLSSRSRSEIYENALPLFTSGRARLLDSPTLLTQLCNLERKTSSGGRDIIDHPKGLHDDVANAACGALVLASLEERPPPKIVPNESADSVGVGP